MAILVRPFVADGWLKLHLALPPTGKGENLTFQTWLDAPVSTDNHVSMIDPAQKTKLQAKSKQPKVLMALMLVFMVAGPLLAPRFFAGDFARLKGVGLKIFYIGTPAFFGALFLFYFILLRRAENKLRGTP
jgi:hypothetical protein